MAYFSNSSEDTLSEQCSKCKYGQDACPIFAIQINYNYDQHNDKSGTATKIMNELVKQDGTCAVWVMAKEHFAVDPNQMEINF